MITGRNAELQTQAIGKRVWHGICALTQTENVDRVDGRMMFKERFLTKLGKVANDPGLTYLPRPRITRGLRK